jgi:Hypothetical protein (DUF2513)
MLNLHIPDDDPVQIESSLEGLAKSLMESPLVEDTILPFLSREDEMQRDMDLIRDILLALEENPDLNGQSVYRGRANEFFEKKGVSDDDVAYHLRLLIDPHYVIGSYDQTSGTFEIERLSMDGHDFLDSVRDPDLWNKTKKGALAAGGFTLALLADIAKGLIKKNIEEKTGIKF